MRFRVRHVTTYTYGAPVRLGPHMLRLRPRAGVGVTLLDHALDIDPVPAGRTDVLDADGNLVTHAWFAAPTTRFTVDSRFEVRTAAGSTDALPDDPGVLGTPYPAAQRARLAQWIAAPPAAIPVGVFADFVAAAARDPADFVARLAADLHGRITHQLRATGAPLPPEQTLALGRGACRDIAMLFIAACRHHGLAARFVSGYQKGSDVPAPRRYMHAWPEVYLPGDGWRGFDPTHGRPVTDAHVALAAAAHPDDAAPIDGTFIGRASSTMTADVRIDVDECTT